MALELVTTSPVLSSTSVSSPIPKLTEIGREEAIYSSAEATQLAIYIGWMLHRTRGVLIAGSLFVLLGTISLRGKPTDFLERTGAGATSNEV